MIAPNRGIYVEIFIASTMDNVWTRTQNPQLHEQWDLRFTKIEYLPRAENSDAQQFLYETRIGFGMRICGMGETVGSYDNAHGVRSSALKFWSDDRKSLISAGSGYWKYIPEQNGVRFLTWYDYETRFGLLGRVFDRAIFRPLISWATAWSFDRLRLWIETGVAPVSAFRSSLIHSLTRLTLAFIWLYHGLIPKLLSTHRDELAMFTRTGVSAQDALLVVRLLGSAELAFGLIMLLTWRHRWLFLVNIGLMILATIGIALTSPEYLGAAFNPVTLNVSVIVLALIGYIASLDTPSAGRCLRMPRKDS